MSFAEEQIYVAELKTPTHLHVQSEFSQVLPHPRGFRVIKGYWIARPPSEQSALEGYAELVLTILFVGKTLKDAEEHALRVGRMFSSLTAAFGGYPLNPPRLHRIAAVDIAERLTSQHSYYYDDQLNESLGASFDAMAQHRLQRYIEFFSLFDEDTRYRLHSAIHWYGIAVGADDPAVSYVAAWTGLECIGLLVDRRFHDQGTKIPCPTCGNQAGEKRDRKMAGIEHVFNSGTLKPVDGFSLEKAQSLRNDAVHGLRECESLMQDCSMFKRFLIDLLNVSILTALTPPEYDGDKSVRSLSAGDYHFQPCSRASIRFSEGQNMSPYLGEWLRRDLSRKSCRRPDGRGRSDLAIRVVSDWILDRSKLNFVELLSYEEYRRSGQEHYPLSDGTPVPKSIPWHDRPPSPAWEAAPDPGWELVSARPQGEQAE